MKRVGKLRTLGTRKQPVLGFNYFASDGPQNAVTAVINGHSSAYYNGRTYIAYQGAQFDLYIAAWVHATETWEGPYFVSKATLVGDSHGYPSLLIESGGTIHMFGGSHVTALIYAKSSSAGDVSTMVVQSSPLATCSYPTPVLTSDGKLWLFYRAGGHLSTWSYITSTDHGATWAAATVFLNYGLAANDSCYAWVTVDSADAFHVTWLWQDENNSLSNVNAPAIGNRYNVYYMKLATGATVKTNLAGTTLGTYPPTLASSNSECRAVDTQTAKLLVQVPMSVVDSSNNPYILWNQMTDTATGLPHAYKVAWYNSGVQTSTIATTDHVFDEYNFECVSGSSSSNVVLHTYLVTSGSTGTNGDYDATQLDRGGNIVEFFSAPGLGSWLQTDTVEFAADGTHLFNSPCLVRASQPIANLVYNDWVNDLTHFTAKVYLRGARGKVIVPYETEAKKLLDRFAVVPAETAQSEINGFLRVLKLTGIFAKLDEFCLMGGVDAQSSRLGWKNLFNLTPVGNSGLGPTWAQAGFTGNGTDSYHNTGMIPSAFTNFAQNDAEFGLWCSTNAQGAAADCGQAFGTSDTYLRLRDTGNQTVGRINQLTTTTAQTLVTDNTNFVSLKRTSSTATQLFRNATAGTSLSQASSARDSTAGHTFWVGGANTGTPQFSTRPLGAFFIGGSLTAAQETFLYRLLYSWFRRRGTI